jgi:ankyrin repeat protein
MDSKFFYSALISAIEHNQEKSVKILLKNARVDPSLYNNASLKTAAELGLPKIVSLLLKYVDPSANDSYVFRLVCYYGNEKLVKLFLNDPRVNPSAHHNSSIEVAASQGHTSIVKILLKNKKMDFKQLSGAIQIATEHRKDNIVAMLRKVQQ